MSTTWAMISTTKMIKVMNKARHGLKAATVISQKAASMVGSAFVNDTDITDGATNINMPGKAILARL